MSTNTAMLLMIAGGGVMIVLGLTAHKFQWINPHDPMTLNQRPASTIGGRILFVVFGLILIVPAVLHFLQK